MPRLFLISGCSGGGKTSLIDALARDGFHTVPEPGRRVIAEEQATNGSALPWVDMAAFAKRAFALATEDLKQVQTSSHPVFFDRGLVDAAVALTRVSGTSLEATLGTERAYHRTVFLAPPWQELFQSDDVRRHSFEDAVAEYEALQSAFHGLGYSLVLLPRMSVAERVQFVLDHVPTPLHGQDLVTNR